MSGAFAAILFAALAQTSGEPYAWPLDLPRDLTSSFAEYRPGRYHMGIDLRTGPIGKDVRAAADGHVSRIRCSPYGYGKAVYVQFDDGNSAVYAHLDDFAPALRDYVRVAQHAREEYTVDLTVPRGQFPVKKGEIIAKSGQTGIGVPHLHYELRDPAGVPVNPRLLGVTWPDTTLPEVRAVALTPIDVQHSRVNGGVRPVVLQANPIAPGLYQTPEVRVTGPVGFAVDVFDPSVGGSKLGVYRVRVLEGADEIFRVEHDRVSYDRGEDGAIAYHPMLADKGKFLTLWRWPGNDSEIYAVSPETGTWVLGRDQREQAKIDIIVEDFHGNASMITVPVRADAAEIPAPPGRGAGVTGKVSFENTGFALIATATFDGDEPETPVLRTAKTSTPAEPGGEFPFRRIGRRTFSVAYHPGAAISDLQVHVDHPGIDPTPQRFVFLKRGAPPQTMAFDDVILRTQPESPYGFLELHVKTTDPGATPGLSSHGVAYEISPTYMPLDAPATLSLPMPAGVSEITRAHVYRRDKDKWARLDTKRPAGRAEVEVKQLGVYAVLEDTTPPTFEVLQPSSPAAANARPVIRLRAMDAGSGINTFRATYNGKWLLLAYDPEQDLLEWEQDEDLPPGAGTLAIGMRDHAGNAAHRELALTIPTR